VKDGSVRPDEDFAMDWELYGDKQSRVKAITDAAKEADGLILATDPDREGEAISWHVRDCWPRAPRAAQGGVARHVQRHHQAGGDFGDEAPRDLDQDLIDAYLARRALDYLFGFTLSPVLWRKLPGAKSAGASIGGAAPDRGARARDRDVQGAGILVGRRADGA
jgi:DNA topoisomerase-1